MLDPVKEISRLTVWSEPQSGRPSSSPQMDKSLVLRANALPSDISFPDFAPIYLLQRETCPGVWSATRKSVCRFRDVDSSSPESDPAPWGRNETHLAADSA